MSVLLNQKHREPKGNTNVCSAKSKTTVANVCQLGLKPGFSFRLIHDLKVVAIQILKET